MPSSGDCASGPLKCLSCASRFCRLKWRTLDKSQNCRSLPSFEYSTCARYGRARFGGVVRRFQKDQNLQLLRTSFIASRTMRQE